VVRVLLRRRAMAITTELGFMGCWKGEDRRFTVTRLGHRISHERGRKGRLAEEGGGERRRPEEIGRRRSAAGPDYDTERVV
jgi:hypothetical protein